MKQRRNIAGVIVSALAIGTLVTVASLVAGPGTVGGPSAANAIIGGTENTSLPWLVDLSLKLAGKPDSSCTGSLISAQWILTARHCIDGGVPAGVGASAPNAVGGPAQLGAIDRIEIAHPDLDVALIHLGTAVSTTSVPTYPRLSAQPTLGLANAYGYGRDSATDETSYPKNSKVGQVEVTSISDTLIYTQGITGQVASGDSGGPVMQHGVLIGVTSDNFPAPTTGSVFGWYGPTHPASAARLKFLLGWIGATTGLSPVDYAAESIAQTIDGVSITTLFRSLATTAQGTDFTYGTANTVQDDQPELFSLLVDHTGALQIENSGGKCLAIDRTVEGIYSKYRDCDPFDEAQKFDLKVYGIGDSGRVQYLIRAAETRECLTGRELPVGTTLTTVDCSDSTTPWCWYINSAKPAAVARAAESREDPHHRAPRAISDSASNVVVSNPVDEWVSARSEATFHASAPGATSIRWLVQYAGSTDWELIEEEALDSSGTDSYAVIVDSSLNGASTRADFVFPDDSTLSTSPALIRVLNAN
jgi:hypothetical protein